MCFKPKPENILIIVDMHTSGTKIVDIPMSKISYEHQGKIFEEMILQTLKLFPAFLASHYPSYSLRYDFMKINIYMIQQRRNVLTINLIRFCLQKVVKIVVGTFPVTDQKMDFCLRA